VKETTPLTQTSYLTTVLDIRRGEYITGFNVRAGVWIDAVQVLTSLGRRSPMFGNVHGGSAYVDPMSLSKIDEKNLRAVC